jgi:hypothetical protein
MDWNYPDDINVPGFVYVYLFRHDGSFKRIETIKNTKRYTWSIPEDTLPGTYYLGVWDNDPYSLVSLASKDLHGCNGYKFIIQRSDKETCRLIKAGNYSEMFNSTKSSPNIEEESKALRKTYNLFIALAIVLAFTF